jgi:conjugative relaxase-like TrwC/TraI family protein
MITARPQKNVQTAKRYFREHLGHGDYYSEGQTVRGVWLGNGAARLGLVPGAAATEAAFLRLCENQHPLTGAQLTVRKRVKDRRVFHDFVVAPPKSVSLLALLAGDARLSDAHAASCTAAMAQLEQLAACRVRRGGRVEERRTGEIVAACFQHDASRSLDPQLHTHFVVFNASRDAVEERWKSLETWRMFEHLGFVTEVYRAELARRVQNLGYRLRQTKGGFEIEGVSEDLIQRFSKRRQAILAEASRLEEELGKTVSNNGRAAIAHAIRERKLRDLSPAEVRAFQRAQMSATEIADLERLKAEAMAPAPKPRVAAVAAEAQQRVEVQPELAAEVRVHTVSPRRLRGWRDQPLPRRADRRSAGGAGLRARSPLRAAKCRGPARPARSCAAAWRGEVTLARAGGGAGPAHGVPGAGRAPGHQAGLAEEQRLIALVNGGVAQCRPLQAGWAGAAGLNDEQRAALHALLHSPDRVLALRGAAGSGKTEVLRGFGDALAGRHEAVFLGPTKSSVKALHEAGLAGAVTVQAFLTNVTLQQRLQRPVLVVDEAGLLSNRQMLALAEWVEARRGRLVLAGDSRQHAGVEAGDALRVLERHSALQTVALHQIQRQTDLEYRAAIADFAAGHGARAVSRLDRLGAVVVVRGGRSVRAGRARIRGLGAGRQVLAGGLPHVGGGGRGERSHPHRTPDHRADRSRKRPG